MRLRQALTIPLLLAGCATAANSGAGAGGEWRALFDGRSLDGWHAWRATTPPTNWRVEDGAIVATAPGPDLVTNERFGSFELVLDWKVAPGGNSGVMYHVADGPEATYETGPEMQVLDDARHPDGKSPLTSAGSAFGLYPAPRGAVKPAGEWNTARLVVRGSHVEHWLNGRKLVEYEVGGVDWNAKVAGSKFRAWPGFGKSATGYIALQDHGDTVAFRNIRIRTLP